ncbi:MAG TPA: serine/threonine-protein kinase, partial [Polyangia bacterium]|nr:serine/threonine-protein kinase [Polyangia bacterium]
FSISNSSEWSVGRRLDRYELLGEIARGGMGTVLLARLAGAGGFSRLFAIKMLHAHLADDEHFVHMLLDEAHLASRIHHSNVVPVVDVCRSEHGLYVVMEYVDGFPFSQILASAALTDGERIAIGVQALLGVLGGLEAAHNLVDDAGAPLGLVHRDVSPQNVLVGIDGLARLADFGIARAAARLTVTEPGTLKGKLAYMAPESARGEPSDRRADVFCAGIMLWECLNGGRLFKGDNEAQTLMRLLSERVVAPRPNATGAAAALDAVCLKALEREVDKRYASAHQMATALAAAAEQAGCLIAPIAVGDLLCARFATEIERRHAKIRGMRSSPSQPGLDLGAALPAMATTYDGEGSGASAFSLPINVETSVETMIGHLSAPQPKVPIGLRAAAVAMVAAFVVAVIVLGGILVYRGQSRRATPASATASHGGAADRPIVTPLQVAPAAAIVAPAATMTATAPAPVAPGVVTPAPVVAPDHDVSCAADGTCSLAPSRASGHRHHTSAHHGHGNGTHGSPTLETNPYM